MPAPEEIIARVLPLVRRPTTPASGQDAVSLGDLDPRPAWLRPGAKVIDPVTGLEAEVIAYDRAAWYFLPPREEGGGGSPTQAP